jgi:four helix bundle protein
LEPFLPCLCHEHRGIASKPTGKTADLLCISDRLAIVETAKNTSRSPYLRQILRSGTAVAANYGEARGAESRADFIHKLKVVFKELNETTIWLEIIAESSLLSPDNIVAIVAENRELCRIIAASIKTARASTE